MSKCDFNKVEIRAFTARLLSTEKAFVTFIQERLSTWRYPVLHENALKTYSNLRCLTISHIGISNLTGKREYQL